MNESLFLSEKELIEWYNAAETEARNNNFKSLIENDKSVTFNDFNQVEVQRAMMKAQDGPRKIRFQVKTDKYGQAISDPLTKTDRDSVLHDVGAISGYIIDPHHHFGLTSARKGSFQASVKAPDGITGERHLSHAGLNSHAVRMEHYFDESDYRESIPGSIMHAQFPKKAAEFYIERAKNKQNSLFRKEGHYRDGHTPMLESIAETPEEKLLLLENICDDKSSASVYPCPFVGCKASFHFGGDLLQHFFTHKPPRGTASAECGNVVCLSCKKEYKATPSYFEKHYNPNESPHCPSPSVDDPLMIGFFDRRAKESGKDPVDIPSGFHTLALSCSNKAKGCQYWALPTTRGISAMTKHEDKCNVKKIKKVNETLVKKQKAVAKKVENAEKKKTQTTKKPKSNKSTSSKGSQKRKSAPLPAAAAQTAKKPKSNKSASSKGSQKRKSAPAGKS